MREKLSRFMMGRCGVDQFSRFLSGASCVVLLIAMFCPGAVSAAISALALAGFVWCYSRIFSRKLDKRREENLKFLSAKDEVSAYFRGVRERWGQRKEYCFFRCPSCRTMLRVPRGKGRIKVVCRKCGNSFIKKT